MKILIVEDESELASTIEIYLSGESYLCEYAGSFDEAIAKVERYNMIVFY